MSAALFERVCFWIPLPEKMRRERKKDMDDEEYFPQQTRREAELFHSRSHTTNQEPTPMAPMYDPRQPPAGPLPGHTSAPPPGMNSNNASRRAILDELHEDRRPTHRNAPSTGQYYPPGNGGQYPPETTAHYSPQANARPPNGSPPPGGFHSYTLSPHDT
ncbi:hypothetical protein BJ165DRAFT_1526889 [Panaeolus papilionaceus]|nr:hypothetical protein BJ165DRAFT_1526889 [Panaeolus papilionaceus]